MSTSRVQLLRLAYVHYQHHDLDEANKFLLDFGLQSVTQTGSMIYYRGYGKDPFCYVAEQSSTASSHFIGGAFVVQSYEELEKAAQIPGSSSIQDADGPGGGQTIIVKDPNGFVVKLLFGQAEVEPSEQKTPSRYNTAEVKDRVGKFHRFNHGPCKAYKLGHYGFVVPETTFLSTRAWYLENFNFAISDTVYTPDSGEDELSFMHIDLGQDYVDHHVSVVR